VKLSLTSPSMTPSSLTSPALTSMRTDMKTRGISHGSPEQSLEGGHHSVCPENVDDPLPDLPHVVRPSLLLSCCSSRGARFRSQSWSILPEIGP
jgi:hypothetical protein